MNEKLYPSPNTHTKNLEKFTNKKLQEVVCLNNSINNINLGLDF